MYDRVGVGVGSRNGRFGHRGKVAEPLLAAWHHRWAGQLVAVACQRRSTSTRALSRSRSISSARSAASEALTPQ